MSIPLEDNLGDVISKAMMGLSHTDATVATLAGLLPEQVVGLRTGVWDSSAARKVALALQLNPEALESLESGSSTPPSLEVDGLLCFSTWFGDMLVNSYLVWDAESKGAIAFDTGADVSGMLEAINEHGLSLQAVLITHTHGDHIFELDRLCEKTGSTAFVNVLEPLRGAMTFESGKVWNIGALTVESRLTAGHSQGGTTYVVRGLSRMVAVVGDALFAGSMGGARVSYEQALRTNRQEIFSLPDECVLCPGHGPLTTVGWESRHNPFFAR